MTHILHFRTEKNGYRLVSEKNIAGEYPLYCFANFLDMIAGDDVATIVFGDYDELRLQKCLFRILSKEGTKFNIHVVKDRHGRFIYNKKLCCLMPKDRYKSVYCFSSQLGNDFLNWLDPSLNDRNTVILSAQLEIVGPDTRVRAFRRLLQPPRHR